MGIFAFPSAITAKGCGLCRNEKKTFPCGHKGYGQICHRCTHNQVVERVSLQNQTAKRQAKQAWLASFEQDPIDLSMLPKHVVLKARQIIAELQHHCNYTDFGGKRLRHDRFIISIPITRHYRMLCRDCGNILVPQAVLSHEDYNVCKPGG